MQEECQTKSEEDDCLRADGEDNKGSDDVDINNGNCTALGNPTGTEPAVLYCKRGPPKVIAGCGPHFACLHNKQPPRPTNFPNSVQMQSAESAKNASATRVACLKRTNPATLT